MCFEQSPAAGTTTAVVKGFTTGRPFKAETSKERKSMQIIARRTAPAADSLANALEVQDLLPIHKEVIERPQRVVQERIDVAVGRLERVHLACNITRPGANISRLNAKLVHISR